ncbi:DUF3891 family protein [Paenibacillaceae bacterium WGS1546]|uniref:DUF3891 family protein n=1 Tax=Cohnella sp. WGS1546 TaxID=3366810 RepID=UPI00372D30D5
MFIAARDGYLHIVNQYDHSVQAGQVAAHWGNETFERPKNFDSVRTAVAKHDIGWVAPDREVLYDAGALRPTQFIEVNLRQHVEFYGAGYEQVLAEDAYAGLLVGMHWIGLYTSRFGYDPTFTFRIPEEMRSFMDDVISSKQKEWIDVKMRLWDGKTSRSDFEEQLWMGYELVQMMDRLSQYVSLKPVTSTDTVTLGRIRTNAKGPLVTLRAWGKGDGDVVVDPFPFSDIVETEVIVRTIPDVKYRSHAEAKEALDAAPLRKVKWRFVPST